MALMILTMCGCESGEYHPRNGLDEQLFGPASVRIHPTFTQIRDLSGKGKPDGIEATLEVEDSFGEPTRSTGRAMFELYTYHNDSPRARGARIGGPWIATLNSRGEQQEHWNAALRAYTFDLHVPNIQTNQYYVLTVQFDLNSTSALTQPSTQSTSAPAGRLFDQLIIEPLKPETGHGQHYHAPTGAPGH